MFNRDFYFTGEKMFIVACIAKRSDSCKFFDKNSCKLLIENKKLSGLITFAFVDVDLYKVSFRRKRKLCNHFYMEMYIRLCSVIICVLFQHI